MSLFTPTTSEAELIARLGEAEVQSVQIPVGEGEHAPGTIVFPKDLRRRLEVLWHDPEQRRSPERVLIRSPESRWVIPPGLGIGTDLKTIEGLNGRPFRLAGFGWDAEGTVTDWEGGRLDANRQRGVETLVRLRPRQHDDAAGLSPPDAEAITGDRIADSDHPAMRQINPVVYELGLAFEEGAAEAWADAARAPAWPRPFAGDAYRCTVQMSRSDWQSLTGERDGDLRVELLDLNGDGLCEVITQHSCGTGGCDGRLLTPRDGALASVGEAPSMSRTVLLEPHAGWLQLEGWYRSGTDYSQRYLLRFEGDAYRQVRADHYGQGTGPDELGYGGTRFEPCCRLTAASGVRLRAAPDPAAAIIAVLPVGAVLTGLETSESASRIGDLEGHWYRARVRKDAATPSPAEPDDGAEGWVFGPLTLPFDPASPDSAYRTLLERRLAPGGPRALADDLDLLRLIARHLAPPHPGQVFSALAEPAVARIGEQLKTACRYDPSDPKAIDFRSLGAEIAGLRAAWETTHPRAGEQAPALATLHGLQRLVRDCAALHLRTRIEREALGRLRVGLTGREVEQVTDCRFRRSPPESAAVGDTFVRWTSPDCGIDLAIIVGEDNDADAGKVTEIRLGQGFTGRTSAGIGIGSPETELVAAYGRYLDEEKGRYLVGAGGEWVCEEGASVSFEIARGRVDAIDLRWGFCD